MHDIPPYVTKCVEMLRQAGIIGYLVGGCVRDLVLGRVPQDYDLTSAASPQEVMALFERVIPTGLSHGTVTVLMEGHPIEITQFRTEGGYHDHRRPDWVRPTSSLTEDLARRDFTINAMAIGPDGWVDPFEGRRDCESRVLRAVGDPQKRFEEDALRIMRLFRFACQLNFSIDPPTLQAALSGAETLAFISRERIFTELKKSLCAPHPSRLSPLLQTNALSFLGLAPIYLPFPKTLPSSFSARLAVLLGLGKDEKAAVCRQLKADRKTTVDTARILDWCHRPLPYTSSQWRQALSMVSEDWLRDALQVRFLLTGESVNKALEELADVAAEHPPVRLSDLALSGQDLVAMGIRGSDIGMVLQTLQAYVWEEPSRNTKEQLLAHLKQNRNFFRKRHLTNGCAYDMVIKTDD